MTPVVISYITSGYLFNKVFCFFVAKELRTLLYIWKNAPEVKLIRHINLDISEDTFIIKNHLKVLIDNNSIREYFYFFIDWFLMAAVRKERNIVLPLMLIYLFVFFTYMVCVFQYVYCFFEEIIERELNKIHY